MFRRSTDSESPSEYTADQAQRESEATDDHEHEPVDVRQLHADDKLTKRDN